MKDAGARFGGLGTRVAARTFALFCLCALVPIVVSAIVADRLVSTQLRREAASRLESTSKSYGLLVFERLRQTDEALSEIAALGLSRSLPLEHIRSLRTSHYAVLEVVEGEVSENGPGARPISLSLNGTQVRISVVERRDARTLKITAAVDPDYLWNPDAVHREAMRICVQGPAGVPLRCVDNGYSAESVDSGSTLSGEWSLFLAPRFGADAWMVRTEQPAAIALAALESFERTLPIVTLIGLGIALLLGTVQIRRSHRPLALLTEAVEKMGRRGVHEPVAIESKDEFRDLAQAFNRMTSSLLKQAYYDSLTGLPNRQLFKDRLEREIAHARRAQTQVAVIYIDLDRFKTVNDSMGHSAGDALLLGVSERLVTKLRESDTLARLGGDEFVVIAPNTDDQPAHVLAERLQAALSEPIVVRDAACVTQASIGLAVYPQDGNDVESLLRSADTAMYRAKAGGPGGIRYFEEAMNRDAQRRLFVEQRLREALRDGGLGLAYQAKVNLNDGSLAGVEALARWDDPKLGPVSPAEFIAVAEECGLIDELGAWVLNEACSTYQQLHKRGTELGHVSVNVSVRQLRDDRFIGEVRDTLARLDMRPAALEVEVTESTLARNPREVSKLLDKLRGMGVRIAIDDFGTGYSSMSVLGELPADALKIDRSFVLESARPGSSHSVVEAIISIAHVLGKVTVAEGVETAEQMLALRRLGCDFAQGYFFAKPVSAAELPGVVARVPAWKQITSEVAAAQGLPAAAAR